MIPEFKPNVDLMQVFHSQIMLIDESENSENGLILIKAGADGPPIHTHPQQEEYFTVIRGQLEVFNNNKWITLKAGDEVFTPKDAAHSYRSRHNEDCLFRYQLTPRLNFSEMLKTFENLTREKKLTSTSDIRSVIYLSLTYKKFSSVIKSVNPPQFVINALAGMGKLFGYQV